MKRILFFSLLCCVMTMAFTHANRVITGSITDDAGKPLIAQIGPKYSKNRVTSATDGSFSLTLRPWEKPILVVSAVGFRTREVTLGTMDKITIQMTPSNETLSEVVVTTPDAIRKKGMMSAELYKNQAAMAATAAAGLQGNIAALQSRGVGQLPVGQFYADRDVKKGGAGKEIKSLDREGYDHITENEFETVADNPLSTFSIDVDAASYSNIRRILKSGQLPTQGAVRIEEMVNYFTYEYAQPTGKDPFAVYTELAVCPWNTKHQLALIGLQGKKINAEELPASNLTFLIDVSGSMMFPDKLPLVQASLKLLVDQLRPQDRVAMVVYAGNSGLVLPSTPGDHKIAIREAIDRLVAGGSTAGGAGIKLAYQVARENFLKQGNNRVILCTDGDFNVGASSDDALESMIEEERKSGVYLTVLGYGAGNYQDAKMQKLADKGNGNHAYIDGISEAKKVLINEFGGTLFTIAKDLKLQVEFNPAKVKGYRLIGYENRMLAKEDFNDDKKDAGELGSGHTVTALYEIVPKDGEMPDEKTVDPLRYQKILNAVTTEQKRLSDEWMTVKLRYKQPDSDNSSLLSYPVKGKPAKMEEATQNLRFASAVASFGMILRKSAHKGNADYTLVRSLAVNAQGYDKEGYRKEFLELVGIASKLAQEGEMVDIHEDR